MDNGESIQFSLDITCSSHSTIKKTTSRIFLDYLQLILYQRCQVPEPIQLIQRKLQRDKCNDTNKNPKKNYHSLQYNKKCLQFIKNIETIKEHLNKLLQQCDEVEAVIAIGSTPVTIKEAFVLKTKQEDDLVIEVGDDTCSDEIVSFYARKFCMRMVQSTMFSGLDPPLTNTRIFVKVDKMAAEGFTPWPNFRFSSAKCKLNVTLNYVSSSLPDGLSNSFINSASGLRLVDPDKENKQPHVGLTTKKRLSSGALAAVSRNKVDDDKTSVSVVETNLSKSANHEITDHTTASERKIPPKKLSVTEALDAVLAEQTADDIEEVQLQTVDQTENGISSSVGVNKKVVSDDNKIWFELPVVIKGFKF